MSLQFINDADLMQRHPLQIKKLSLALMAAFASGPVFSADCVSSVGTDTVISSSCEANTAIAWTGGWIQLGQQDGPGAAITGMADPQIAQSGTAYGLFVYGGSSLGSVEINGTLSNYGDSLWVGAYDTGSVIDRVINRGTFANDDGDGAVVIFPGNTINEFWNLGTISPGVNIGISNAGTLGTLINAQGGAYPLVYRAYTSYGVGNLPDKYITYFSDSSTYGKIAFSNLGAYTLNTYGIQIADGQNWASGTFNSVITSDQALSIANYESVSGITYYLESPDGGLTWNLVVVAASPTRVFSATQALHNAPAGPAAQVIDATPALSAYFANLTTDPQLSAAASQTLPLLTGGSMIAAQGALSGINRVIQARIEGNNHGMSSGDAFMGDKNFWLKPFGSWADQDDMAGVSGFEAETWGLAIGADKALSDRYRLGVAFAYANSNVDSNSAAAPQTADVDVYQLVGYGSYMLDEKTELNFQIDAGQNTNKGRRILAFASAVANSDFNSWTAHAGLGLARSFKLNDATTFTPSVRADYTWMKDESYAETGAGLFSLNVDSRNSEALVLGVDGKIAHNLDADTALTANLGVGYDAINDKASITAAFAGAPTSSFVTYGLDPSPWLGRAGVGLVHRLKTGTEITARYDAEFREDFVNQTASIKARWAL